MRCFVLRMLVYKTEEVSRNHVRLTFQLEPTLREMVPLLLVVALFSLSPCYQCREDQRHSETLFLRPLADGRVSATFEFSTTWSVHPLRFSSPANGEL